MRFDWDAGKATTNRRKHGVSFEDAITAFDDPYALLAPDPTHSMPREQRTWLIGEGDPGVLVVVFTVRDGGEVVRLISARRANRRERKRYEESKGLPV
jgi:uncharacterized DUF497 family protein